MMLSFIALVALFVCFAVLVVCAIYLVFFIISCTIKAFKGNISSSGYPSEINSHLF